MKKIDNFKAEKISSNELKQLTGGDGGLADLGWEIGYLATMAVGDANAKGADDGAEPAATR